MADPKHGLVIHEETPSSALPVLSPPPTYSQAMQNRPKAGADSTDWAGSQSFESRNVLSQFQNNQQQNTQGRMLPEQSSSSAQFIQLTQPRQIVYVQQDFAAGKAYHKYYIMAIVALILCHPLWPIGLYAIIKASRAKTLAMLGRKEEAQLEANCSLGLTITNVLLGIAAVVAIVVVVLT